MLPFDMDGTVDSEEGLFLVMNLDESRTNVSRWAPNSVIEVGEIGRGGRTTPTGIDIPSPPRCQHSLTLSISFDCSLRSTLAVELLNLPRRMAPTSTILTTCHMEKTWHGTLKSLSIAVSHCSYGTTSGRFTTSDDQI